MYLLPAIDILGGKAVRLAKGDYDRVTVYHDDPAAQAQLFEEQGATWLHVVDLDGARSGIPENIAMIASYIDYLMNLEENKSPQLSDARPISRWREFGLQKGVLRI